MHYLTNFTGKCIETKKDALFKTHTGFSLIILQQN